MKVFADLPRLRADAISMGLTHFYTGLPCGNGHLAERFASNGSCAECLRGHARLYHQRHLLTERQRKAQWAKDNPEKNAAQSERWKQANPQKEASVNRQSHRKRRSTNPELCKLEGRAAAARRRARQLNAGGNYTAADVKKLFLQQRGKCYWCRKKLGDKFDVDHIIPLSRGGSNGVANLCIACPSCNGKKFTKLPEDFAGRWF